MLVGGLRILIQVWFASDDELLSWNFQLKLNGGEREKERLDFPVRQSPCEGVVELSKDSPV